MSSFYKTFEDKHRGSRELIASRLRQYLPFLLPLKADLQRARAADLGCGRCEWLELVRSIGFESEGVDLDQDMLNAFQGAGLNVWRQDALEYLDCQEDESLDLVTAFHLIEHISFDQVKALIANAFRVLRPGGLLILETPNPENILVATSSFYLDPTHVKPIPPALLQFSVEYAGFTKVVVARLQESPDLRDAQGVTLLDALGGVSPDYSVIALKPGDLHRSESLELAFSKKIGLQLSDLAGRFEGRLQAFGRADELSQNLDRRFAEFETESERRVQDLDRRFAEFERESERRFVEFERVSEGLQQQLESHIKELNTKLAVLETHVDYIDRRGVIEKLLFRTNGRPVKLLRRLLFHTSGKPRRLTRILVLHNNGTPRRAFSYWMMSSEYLELRNAVKPPERRSGLKFFPDFSIDPTLHERYSGKKVALLAPVSSQGIVGGAERFYAGLTESLRSYGCDVTVLQVPVDESSFEAIQDAYRYFEGLDLSKFDCVVSTKAPSYAIFHPNHVVYLVHTIRVFYDMFEENDDRKAAQRDWIHRVDTQSITRAKACFTIGREVSDRLVESSGINARVLRPPLALDGLYFQNFGDYFFMPGRLHRWKRVDLAVKAILASKLEVKLLVCGEGEAEPALRELSAGDKRIEFLGRISDSELYGHYANCLAVPFLPVREDYGYVTLEAFASGKPVITCSDSGEPAKIVQHELTGLIVEPTVESLTHAFERLWRDRDLAKRFGNNARAVNDSINWKSVTPQLLNAAFETQTVTGERECLRVAVLDMQPIMPPVGGGRIRLLGLYHNLGSHFDTRYVGSYDWPGEPYREQQLSHTLTEIVVPLSNEHHAAARESSTQSGGRTVIDALFGRQGKLSPFYIDKVEETVRWADVVVFSHPWVAPLIPKDMLTGKTVVYDAQNCEGRLRRQLLDPNDPYQAEIINYVIESERYVGDIADVVLACSREDKESFADDYSWSDGKVRIVPNGVFCNDIEPFAFARRLAARKELGISDKTLVAFFLGSNYEPNVEAASYIIHRLAPSLPLIQFVVGGGCTAGLSQRSSNCKLVGYLPPDVKRKWLTASNIALNPIFVGSGTNVKIFEYMAYSLPVISTQTGARGIAEQTKAGLTVCAPEEFAQQINNLVLKTDVERNRIGLLNRKWVEEEFDWSNISQGLGVVLRATQGGAEDGEVGFASQRIAHLSTTGLTCGIGEYTRKLILELKTQGAANLLLAASNDEQELNLATLPQPAVVVWKQDTREWRYGRISRDALRVAVEWGANRFILQYHPGFYAASDIAELARGAIQQGMATCLVVHNFLDHDAPLMRYLSRLGCELFGHRQTTVRDAQLHGVKLRLMPFPVHSFNFGIRGPHDNNPQIVAFGFIRKHKGFSQLIAAMPLIVRGYPSAKLKVIASEYPSSDSRSELIYCSQLIEQLNLGDIVTLESDFKPPETVHHELLKSDLAVLPYGVSNEGGSAAAADCLAAGLPLIVSEAEIFDGIREYCFTTEASPEAIANSVLTVLSDPDTYASLAAAANEYRQKHTWAAAARLLVGWNGG